MRGIVLIALITAVASQALAGSDPATQAEIDAAWLAFSNARGEASLILGDPDHPAANAVFRPIPAVNLDKLDEDKLQLGFDLFNEARLSRDGTISCSSCHIGMLGGVDRRPLPFGIDGAQGEFNVPTIFNSALNFRQFWDGRALTLQEQALGPIENPIEFGHDRIGAISVLNSIPEYAERFAALYPDGITDTNLGDAIAYYETMNFTGLESPFLRQFEPGQESMSQKALRGQQRFVEVGCASCHNGINLGGNSYQQLGAAEPWYNSDQPADETDNGLFGRTGRDQDLHVFKVPTLHNVATTGPWLHDGSVTSLQQAVDQMAQKQSGRYLKNEDIDDIVAFLRALGDPQSLIGDCAASGNYGVTMDCNVKQVTASSTQSSVDNGAHSNLSDNAQHHQQEYAAAVARVAEAPERIETEMRRIRSGEVSHFDFLQFEHIEMLRHARALSFPPANTDPQQRQALLAQAAQWQDQAQDYELLIADFLRAQAIANSARANYQDILRTLPQTADEKLLVSLTQAEDSALAYYADPNPDTQRDFEATTQALLDSNLDQQLLEELQIQLRLLKASADSLAISEYPGNTPRLPNAGSANLNAAIAGGN